MAKRFSERTVASTVPDTRSGSVPLGPPPWWRSSAALTGAALLVLILLAYLALGPAQPWLIQRGLALLSACLATLTFLLATRKSAGLPSAMDHFQSARHSDFGKLARERLSDGRREFRLPGVGEITGRKVAAGVLFVAVFLWWLSPFAPVSVAAPKLDDLSVRVGERIIAAELAAPDGRLAFWQPPVILPDMRATAALIDDSAEPYQLALRALVEGQHEQADRLLDEAGKQAGDQAIRIELARAQNAALAGRFEESLEHYRQALSGEDNNVSLLCQASVTALQASQPEQAAAWAQQALQAAENTPADQPDRGLAYHVDGLVKLAAGRDLVEAERSFKRSQDAWAEVLPPNHPLLAASRNNQGMVYAVLGRYVPAVEVINWGREGWRRDLGPDHPLVATGMDNLAMVLLQQGRLKEARQQLDAASGVLERPPAADPAIRAMHRANLAAADLYQADWPKAAKQVENVFVQLEQRVGEKHPLTAGVLCLMGEIHEAQSLYAKAEAYYFRALAAIRRVCGEDHPYAALVELKLARLNLARGEPDLADPLVQHATAVIHSTLGERHPWYALALLTQGEMQLAREETSKARQSLEEAREVAEELFEEDHPQVARIRAAAAALENSPLTYKRGVLEYRRAIDSLSNTLGEEHPAVARATFDLAKLYIRRGKHDEAIEPLKQCYRVLKKQLPSFHPLLADVLESYATVLESRDTAQAARAAELRQQASDVRRRHLERDRVD